MKASELRIGNYVKNYLGTSDNGAEYKNNQIETFYENGVHVGFGKCYKYSECEPILLTEEWLIKFGFRKTSNKLLFLPIPNLVMEIHAIFYRGQWLIELANDRRNIVTEVFNVHEIQNLYQALTLKELICHDPQDRIKKP